MWHEGSGTLGTKYVAVFVNFITRKQQNPKAKPAMKQSEREWLLFNQEMKVSENNWIKNTVTRLITGNKSGNSRLISLPPKNECQCAHSSGANTQNEEWSLSSKDLHLPKEKSHGFTCLSALPPQFYVPWRQNPQVHTAAQCRNAIKIC